MPKPDERGIKKLCFVNYPQIKRLIFILGRVAPIRQWINYLLDLISVKDLSLTYVGRNESGDCLLIICDNAK